MCGPKRRNEHSVPENQIRLDPSTSKRKKQKFASLFERRLVEGEDT